MTSGWQCPGCARCYAPWVASCAACDPSQGVTTYRLVYGQCPGCGCIPCQRTSTGCPPSYPPPRSWVSDRTTDEWPKVWFGGWKPDGTDVQVRG